MAANKNSARGVGAAIVAVVAVVAVGATVYQNVRPEEGMPVTLHTQQVGDGVVSGTEVRLDGVQVGEVTDVVPDTPGTQRISLRLDKSRLFDIDDSLHIDYSPANFFGISELELRRGEGGSPLRPDALIELTGRDAERVYDATLGAILRSLSQVGDNILTPDTLAVLNRFSTDLPEFTPLLESIIVASRTVVEKQTINPSLMLGQFGSALDGGADIIDSTVKVIDLIYRNKALRESRDKVDSGIDMVTDRLLPNLEQTLNVAGTHFAGFTDMLAPVLAMLAGTVPTPEQSSADLRAMVEHFESAFADTPDGKQLNASVELRGIPVLADMLPFPPADGGPR
ncbi:MlaD family protein [Nocardia callitridis]|uniref:Mce/MlaD domain-containing protein n=1 Tax=Nocardia callitridis TaxID=648753 RepID=A0ABP9KJC2_9NOCA